MTMLFLLSILCWRITYMLTAEEGPYKMFFKLRVKAVYYKWSPLHCFYCTSVWVALPLSVVTGNWYFYWLIISAMSIFLQALHEKLQS